MTTQTIPRTAHPYFMYDMIQGQPQAIARVLNEEADVIGSLARSLNSAERIHVVGIGTSWHASLVGEFLLRTVGGRGDARAWNSFEFCAYPPELTREDAVLVMTHRGTKTYSARALELAKSGGAQTAVFSGIDSDARTDLAYAVVRTSIPEKSSAFTISHTAAMTALAMLAAELGTHTNRTQARELQQELKRLPELVEAALAREPEIREWARAARDAERFYFAGWGSNASTAYEVALKIKESSYLVTEGFQLEQYLHGPFVATEKGCVVTFIAPPGVGYGRAIDLISAASETGAHTVVLVENGDRDISSRADTVISLPAMPEALTPVAYLVPLQLFTYWLALETKRNPDIFRLDDPMHQAARQKYQL
jgi:glucosamine--fructose-6-phosphate aminotransferase (isomerizing)